MAAPGGAIRRAPMFRDRTNVDRHRRPGGGLVYLAFRFVSWAFVNAIWTLPTARLRGLSRREGRGRVLGRHQRALSLHPVRRLSVRRAMAAGAGLPAVRARSTRRAPCGRGGSRWLLGLWIAVAHRRVALLRGGAVRAHRRAERILGRTAADVRPVDGRLRRGVSARRGARARAALADCRPSARSASPTSSSSAACRSSPFCSWPP